MMNEEKLLTVARYLEGDMAFQEKQEFETLLKADTELQDLVAEYTDVHQALKMMIAPSVEDKQVAATLSTLNKQYFKAEKPSLIVSLKPHVRWMSIAAVLIIGLFIWAPWSAGLYEKYSISKEMSVVERGSDQPGQLEKAASLYNAKDYKGAGSILQKEYMMNPGNSMLTYYFAITLIENSKGYEARTLLQHLYKGESAFKYDAAYYMALSFVKENNKEQALEWLKKIPEGTANYEKANELAGKLR